MPQGSDFYQKEEMEKRRAEREKELDVIAMKERIKELEVRIEKLERKQGLPMWWPDIEALAKAAGGSPPLTASEGDK